MILPKGYETKGKGENRSQQAWERVIQMYESYIKYLNEMASQQVGGDGKKRYLAYPEIDKQKNALFRIAEAYRKLGRHEQAIEKLEKFYKEFPESELAIEALYQIGTTCQDWAKNEQENEPMHLNDALGAYNRILDNKLISPDDSVNRMRIYAKMGDIKYRMYNRGVV